VKKTAAPRRIQRFARIGVNHFRYILRQRGSNDPP